MLSGEVFILSFFLGFLCIKLKLILAKNARQLKSWLNAWSFDRKEFYYTPRIFNNKYKFVKSSNVPLRYTNETTYRSFWEFRSKNEDHKPHFLKKTFLSFRIVFSLYFCYETAGTALAEWLGNFAWRVEMTRARHSAWHKNQYNSVRVSSLYITPLW